MAIGSSRLPADSLVVTGTFSPNPIPCTIVHFIPERINETVTYLSNSAGNNLLSAELSGLGSICFWARKAEIASAQDDRTG